MRAVSGQSDGRVTGPGPYRDRDASWTRSTSAGPPSTFPSCTASRGISTPIVLRTNGLSVTRNESTFRTDGSCPYPSSWVQPLYRSQKWKRHRSSRHPGTYARSVHGRDRDMGRRRTEIYVQFASTHRMLIAFAGFATPCDDIRFCHPTPQALNTTSSFLPWTACPRDGCPASDEYG